MKKFISLLLSIVLALSSLIGVSAASNNVKVYLNGSKIEFDVQPQIINDRTMVPMRAIFEAMDCEVVWHQNLQQIVVWKNDELLMNLGVGRKYMDLFDFGTKELDVPPMIVDERTLVPLRAISESIGATVDWNGKTQTVNITYKQTIATPDNNSDDDDECQHKNVTEVLAIDLRKYVDIGSSSKHKVVDVIELMCNDCSEIVDTTKKETNKSHSFSNGVCEYCGYELEIEETPEPTATPTPTQRPVSSTKISDYVNGAFMYITVPAGKSIKIPNTSDGSLTITLEGVGNIMECGSDGSYDIHSYNDRDTKTSFKISKKSYAIAQNSGDSDMVVSLPAEYATYQETGDKVFEILRVSAGENIKIAPTREKKRCKFYTSSTKYEWISYYTNKDKLYQKSLSHYNKYFDLGSSLEMLITANEDMEFYYCPFTTSCQKTSSSPYVEITVASGETVRVSTVGESQSIVYTDGESNYDYVAYNSDGKVTSQGQGKHNDYISLGTGYYLDFTNIADYSVTLKIPSLYTTVK